MAGFSSPVVEFGAIRRQVVSRTAETNPAAPLQTHLLAAKHELLLAAKGYKAAIGAVIDQVVSITAFFNSGVLARRFAVFDNQLIFQVAPEQYDGQFLVKKQSFAAIVHRQAFR